MIAACAFALIAIGLVYPLVKLGRFFGRLSTAVQEFTESTLPLLEEVTTTVATTNEQLVKIDTITTNVAQVSTNVSALTSLFAATLGSPLVKVAAFSYGVRQAMGRRRAGRGGTR